MAVRLNQLRLTKYRLNFPFQAGSKVVRKKWDEAKVDEKWKNSTWAKNSLAKRKVHLSTIIITVPTAQKYAQFQKLH